MIVSVRRKTDGSEVTRYAAQAVTEIDGFPFAEYDHVEYVEGETIAQVDPANWRIYVGAFFDRFGASKLGILSSDDAMIQAAIKDCSVRKYIDLKARRDELAQTLGYFATKGFALDITAVLDTEPTDSEVWQPFIL